MECGSVSTGAGGPSGIRQGGKKDTRDFSGGHRSLEGLDHFLLGNEGAGSGESREEQN